MSTNKTPFREVASDVSGSKEIPGLAERIQAAVESWTLARGHRGVVAFARTAGISHDALKRYVTGAQEPGAYALWRIAETAGVSLDHLVRGHGEGMSHGEESPAKLVHVALRALRLDIERHRLPRDAHRRALDFISFVAAQIRRMMFDADRFVSDLRAVAAKERFDIDEHRRRFLAEWEDEP